MRHLNLKSGGDSAASQGEQAVEVYRPVKDCSKSALPACMQNYILPYVSALARHAHVFMAFSAPLLHASMCFLSRMCTTMCVLHTTRFTTILIILL